MKIVVGDKWRLFSGCDLVARVKSEVGEVGEVVSEQEQGQGGEGGGRSPSLRRGREAQACGVQMWECNSLPWQTYLLRTTLSLLCGQSGLH